MKKSLKAAIASILLVFTISFTQAQIKIGYIDFQSLLGQMPEATAVRSQIDAYQKQFVDQLTVMNNDLQTKNGTFQAELTKVNDAVRTSRLAELQDLQKRIQDYQTSAQSKVQAKSGELVKPLADKARALIRVVAKEKGYNYVFDSSGGPVLAVSPAGDDLMSAVKAKMGVK
ncbi:MAG: OmpH family outer membrane protein [Sphingobacteriaceae bacterium]|nr:MAG: OmpH family outer membrane protein [Sphingobacteriaceae bacterium]